MILKHLHNRETGTQTNLILIQLKIYIEYM